jgi:hypothetical protein
VILPKGGEQLPLLGLIIMQLVEYSTDRTFYTTHFVRMHLNSFMDAIRIGPW